MSKYDPNHTPEGKDAQKADLPKDFRITGSIRTGAGAFGKGFEAQYAATEPSVADVERLVEAGAIGVMNRDGQIVPFEVEAADDADTDAADEKPVRRARKAKTTSEEDAPEDDAPDA